MLKKEQTIYPIAIPFFLSLYFHLLVGVWFIGNTIKISAKTLKKFSIIYNVVFSSGTFLSCIILNYGNLGELVNKIN